jgi:cyclopropane fatty-acyl-phospholipid synthase-like methyltransferase
MYGEHDLSSTSLFSGHFINFGYWQNLTAGQHLTIDDRTASQANLYRAVLRRAGVGSSDSLLEVGCGIGVGPDRLMFQAGSALTIPAEDKSFNKCISIEAAQHFEDLAMFAREAHRVLRRTTCGLYIAITEFPCLSS